MISLDSPRMPWYNLACYYNFYRKEPCTMTRKLFATQPARGAFR